MTLYEMGAMADRVAEMRNEMETAIEMASNGQHDSTTWWDSDYAVDGLRPIEVLLGKLERIAARYASELSREN